MSLPLPKTIKAVQVIKPGIDFRKATTIVDVPMPVLNRKQILVKTKWMAINASDIKVAAGVFYNDKELTPPYGIGFEGIGEVVGVDSEITKVKVGQDVAFMHPNGSFSEYCAVDEHMCAPVPFCDPMFLGILLSGFTASIAFETQADLAPGKKVLITAAAGGTGQIAIQLAKIAGCHVIGTCSSMAKVQHIKSLGCDRAINYKEENLDEVLSKEYPNGVDVVYECVGGELFETVLKNIATMGRIIIIGQMSGYKDILDQEEVLTQPECRYPICRFLLQKSASLRAFHLRHYEHSCAAHAEKLAKLVQEKKLKVVITNGEDASTGPFKGMESLADALDYMYSGKNVGKIVVEM